MMLKRFKKLSLPNREWFDGGYGGDTCPNDKIPKTTKPKTKVIHTTDWMLENDFTTMVKNILDKKLSIIFIETSYKLKFPLIKKHYRIFFSINN